MKNRRSLSIILSIEKGYNEINGEMFYKKKKLKPILYKNYYFFGVKIKDGTVCLIPIHRFVAYKKFGNKIFNKKLQVRHLDSNSLNNNFDNIGIGTAKENSSDKDPVVVRNAAMIASNAAKKHNHNEIIELHKQGFSYKQIMKKLNITSKGTISFIIKNSIESKN
jgi:hypothetical protein